MSSGALAQRRHIQRQDIQPVIQILAETALGDRLAQSHIGRRNDPHIDADRLTAADPHDLALLQEAQQMALQIHRHVADLVQEQRAAVGVFDLALGARDARR